MLSKFIIYFSLKSEFKVSKISIEVFFALGVSILFVMLIFEFGDSIGQGTNSIISRFIGADDYESAYNLFKKEIGHLTTNTTLYFLHTPKVQFIHDL